MRSARSISSAVIFVAERITMPSYSPIRSASSSSSQSIPSSTSKCSRSSATPESPIFSLTSTRGRPPFALRPTCGRRLRGAHRPSPLEDPVDAGGQRLDVGGLDRGEHADPQLVAPELAVGLDVDDAVCAQRRRERGRVELLVEVDRADDQRALGGVGTNGVA